MTSRRAFTGGAAVSAAFAAACASPFQSALHPAGPHADRIHSLFIVFTIVVSLVWVAVIGMLVYAVLRGRRREEAALDAHSRRRARNVVAGAVGATVLILIGLLVTDLIAGRDLAAMTDQEPAVTIELIGNQWWWEARYEHVDADRRLTTANELHIPVGVPVLVKLKSHDVIHSLWVPNLNGKQDLIPGYTNVMWLQADSVGEYRGQCAEYCGHQHAHMALPVIVHSASDYAAWMQAQLRPAAEPATEDLRRGRDVFLSSACLMCHTIRGTPAGGRTGPDLTHIGSRRTLAAGTLPNNLQNLARWIANPQHIKPGVRMPVVPLSAGDRDAVARYLESLR